MFDEVLPVPDVDGLVFCPLARGGGGIASGHAVGRFGVNVVQCAVQVAQHGLADSSCGPVFALNNSALALALDIQVNPVITAERCAKHNVADALEALADSLLKWLGGDATQPTGCWVGAGTSALGHLAR